MSAINKKFHTKLAILLNVCFGSAVVYYLKRSLRPHFDWHSTYSAWSVLEI
jgi:hypothetical protein